MNNRHIVAIDLGASSGRIMLARYNDVQQKVSLETIYRFSNKLSIKNNHYYWDIDEIEKQILVGLNLVTDLGVKIDSIGIDTWAVDYVLLDKDKKRIGPVYSYRDIRTDGVMPQVQKDLGIDVIYQKTGIQFQKFNTLYQLKALKDENPEWLSQVEYLVMIPDYLAFRLTGQINCEYTNATTTQMVNIQTGDWDEELIQYLGLPRKWFQPIKQPGNIIGHWQARDGQSVPVISVASHDTASAVLATPLLEESAAYLSSGTWSLIGLDSPDYYTGDDALQNNITNEGGVNNHFRVLKNIMGHWLFQRICNEYQVANTNALLEKAKKLPAFVSLINPNDDVFLNPKSMTEAIQVFCKQHKEPIPETVEELSRCIFDSLALLYGVALEQLAALQKKPIMHLHIVGGGSQNTLLNQLCADVCQIPLSAGPIEGSALGNVGCQLMTINDVKTVQDFREMLVNSFPIIRYQSSNPISETIKNRFGRISDSDNVQ